MYLEQHGRRPTEEAIAEYLDWCDSFTDTLMSSYPMPNIPIEPYQEGRQPPMFDRKPLCPLLAIASSADQQSIPAHCVEDRCAWYDSGNCQCAIQTIAGQTEE